MKKVKNNRGAKQIKKYRKQQVQDQGVTMLALVITIIILLILSGITIRFVVGEDGIIGQAKQASLKYQNSSLQEQILLNSMDEQIADIENGSSSGSGSGSGPSDGDSSSGDSQETIDNLNQKINDLQQKIDALEDKLEESEAERNENESKVSELENKNNELQTKLAESETERAQSQTEINNIQKEKEKLETKISELESEIDKLENQITQLNNTITNLEEQIKTLQNEYNKGYEDGAASKTYTQNYHFNNATNDYSMTGWTTMHTITQDGQMLCTVGYVVKGASNDFVQARLIDSSGNVVYTFFYDSSPGGEGTSRSTAYTLEVKSGYKIQIYGQNSRREGYVYYAVDGYVLYK